MKNKTAPPDIAEAFELYNSVVKRNYLNWNYGQNGDPPVLFAPLTLEVGKTYIRIVHNRAGRPGHGRAFGFINLFNPKFKRGDLLKTASWRAPTLNFARGNIFDPESYVKRTTWTGVS